MSSGGTRAMIALSVVVGLLPLGCGSGSNCTTTWVDLSPTPLDRSILSVWGRSRTDVFLVGGGLMVSGLGALVLHYDGSRWRELNTQRNETLWWVWGPDSQTTWMVGESGLVLRYRGGQFEKIESGTVATLFGVWGSGPNDVWIVGGLPGLGSGPHNDVLLHWDGQSLTRDTSLPAKGAALFKVWGASDNDLWVSGELGTLWRRQGGQWTDYSSELATTSSLLTVHGCAADEVYAVGGNSVWAFDGQTWSEIRQAPSGANGVSCGSEFVVVVGNGGMKQRMNRRTGEWFDDRLEEPFKTGFHGAWASPEGDLWAGGGNFLSPPSVGSRTGVVGFRGCARPPAPR